MNQECLSVMIPGIGSIDELLMNVNVRKEPLDEKEKKYISEIKRKMQGEFCHRCGYCLPCTKGIDIPGIFTLEKYFLNYNLQEWASKRYVNLSSKASDCINCGLCVSRCPYGLNIPKKLSEISKLFK